jgi:hypothetical protein
MRKSCFLPVILIMILFAHGCASLVSYQFRSRSPRPLEEERFLSELDTAVSKAGVQNAAYFKVTGFPYLRADRFLVSLKDRLDNDDQKNQWMRWLQQLDIEARESEIRNLPASTAEKLAAGFGFAPDRKILQEKVISYSDKLLAHDRLQSDFFDVLEKVVQGSDEYSTLMRIFGLYPITAIPVAVVTDHVYSEITKWHQLAPEERQVRGTLTVYGPAGDVDFSMAEIQQILERSKQNPLGVPRPSSGDQKTLLVVFAPVIVQDMVADYDKIGAVAWGEKQLEVDSNNPTVYYYFSNAYFKGEPILQINYVFWFSARSGPLAPRIERGHFDGLTVRVSLSPEGSPFMVDIMNNCGCYHFFVPRKEKVKRILPSSFATDAFVPTWLPHNFSQERLTIRLNSGWHQVENITARKQPAELIAYNLIPYRQLEMLPRSGNANESMFTSSGIGKYSERIEPLIFFPMGIPDIGNMRQRGHHAVKFVGRAHFDDPRIFDRNFEFN